MKFDVTIKIPYLNELVFIFYQIPFLTTKGDIYGFYERINPKSSRGWICNYKEVNFNNKTIIMKKKNFSNEDDAYSFYKEVKEKYITDLKNKKDIWTECVNII